MNYNYNLTIIIPGIRNEHWRKVFDNIQNACKKYTYEVIFCGPHALPDSLQKEKNVKYIKDFGTPTRALHLSTLLAEGKYFTWLADDCVLYQDSIDLAMDLLLSQNHEKDIVCMRYTEGHQHSGAEFPPSYWIAGTHADLRAPGVNPDWKIPIVMLLALERYKYLGGFDCAYEHVNMNLHDFSFRAQRDGSFIHMSPTQIQNCDFELNRTVENSAVIAAFWENDRPLFWEHYKAPEVREIRIDPENWRKSSPVWHRRKY